MKRFLVRIALSEIESIDGPTIGSVRTRLSFSSSGTLLEQVFESKEEAEAWLALPRKKGLQEAELIEYDTPDREEREADGVDEVVCPYCKEVYSEINPGDMRESGVFECGECERSFHLKLDYTIHTTSTSIPIYDWVFDAVQQELMDLEEFDAWLDQRIRGLCRSETTQLMSQLEDGMPYHERAAVKELTPEQQIKQWAINEFHREWARCDAARAEVDGVRYGLDERDNT